MTTAKALEFFSRVGLPKPVTEHEFHAKREWRFDFAWPEYKVALEVDGGVYSGGRHVQPEGFLKDKEKFNHAAALGWRILYCTPRSLVSFGMAKLIKEAIEVAPCARLDWLSKQRVVALYIHASGRATYRTAKQIEAGSSATAEANLNDCLDAARANEAK